MLNIGSRMICMKKPHVLRVMNYKSAVALLVSLILAGCAISTREPMQPVSHVNIEKFMGDWYVLANIPTFPERGALNPIERYELNPDGTIKTTFSFIHGKSGEARELNARGFVREGTSNAIWGMQFIWPIKADYRIVYLDPDYSTTIIGRNKRDYLWIMSRDQRVSDERLAELIDIAEKLGYDPALIEISNWQRPETEQDSKASVAL
jgi:apolipoprotein D and lipocalin family protein